MKKIKFALFAFSILGAGCDKDTLPKYSTLDRLRILAIVADTPEIQNPSAGIINVQVTPYISDISGSGDVQLELQSCLDPGVELGASSTCENSPTASSIQTISVSSTSTVTEGLFGNPERTGSPQSGAIAVPLTIPNNLLDLFPASYQHNGVSYIITLKATSGSKSVSSFRRILHSNKTANTNPTISDIKVDGVIASTRPTEGTKQLLLETASTPESYQFLTGDGQYRSMTESYEVSWFVSEGVIESSRSDSNTSTEWQAPASILSATTKLVIVGVLRDGRGGLAVKVRNLAP